MKYIYFISLLILSSAILSSAQLDGSNLSGSCKAKVEQLIADKDINACFPFLSVAPVVLNNQTDPASLTKLADSICGLPKCSDNLVSKTRADIKAACQSDLSSNNMSAEFVYYILILYSPARDSVCFKNSTGGYCFIESMESAGTIYKPGQDPTSAFVNAPNNVICTPCNKAIANTFFNFQQSNPDLIAEIKELSASDIDSIKRGLSGKCGKTFLDGTVGDSTLTPTDLSQQQDNKPNSAISLVVNRLSFVALVGSVIAIL